MNRAPLSLDSLLLGYATGSLGTAESLVVAALLALNENARRAVARFEALGGRVIEEENPADVCGSCLESVLKRIALEAVPVSAPEPSARCRDIPEPLRSLLAACAGADAGDWRGRHGGAKTMEIHITVERAARGLRLLEIPPGGRVPPHSHTGPEITLVLEGAYRDAFGVYQKGDIQIIDGDRLVHSPEAGAQGCACLVLTEGPLRFTNPLQQILGVFFGV